MGKLEEWHLTAIEKLRDLIFCSVYNAPTLFQNLQEIFDVQGTWHSPNMLPTTAGFSYYKLTTPHREEGIPYPPPGDVLSSFVGLIPRNLQR
jgi:hypothetical protein